MRAAESGSLPWPTRPSLTSVGWIHVRNARLLAVRSRGRQLFYLPGGKPEPGESYEQALSREVDEELGVHLRSLRPAFAVTAPAHGLPEPTDLTMYCYYADPIGHPGARREIDELAWLTLPADERAAPALSAVLSRLAPRTVADPSR